MASLNEIGTHENVIGTSQEEEAAVTNEQRCPWYFVFNNSCLDLALVI